MQQVLRNALVCAKICEVDNSDNYRIQNPYSSQPTATVQAVAGTYSTSAWTLTDDTLTVTDEVVYAEQVYDFERVMNNFDLIADRIDNQNYAIAYQIDKYVLNNLTTNATGTYTTAAGGFTTPQNVAKIMGDLIAKVAGYAQVYKGLYLVIENTDITGFIQTQVASGFSYADSALNNGFMQSYMGVDIYVVRSGTFVTASLGSTSVTAAGQRVFGVKNVSTYASPRGIQFIEKEVSGKTGVEMATVGLIGFKLWTQNAGLTVAVTLA